MNSCLGRRKGWALVPLWCSRGVAGVALVWLGGGGGAGRPVETGSGTNGSGGLNLITSHHICTQNSRGRGQWTTVV